jgi:hypothetical protein
VAFQAIHFFVRSIFFMLKIALMLPIHINKAQNSC